MRVSDCCTSSREVTRPLCSARLMSPIDASTTVKRGGAEGAAASAAEAASARTSDLVLIGGRRGAKRSARLLQQIRFDEWIQVAVEHAVHVADLHFGAMVLDHLIRLQNIAADLTAEAYFLLRPGDLLQLRRLLLHLQVEQPRFQHFHRLGAVLVL